MVLQHVSEIHVLSGEPLSLADGKGNQRKRIDEKLWGQNWRAFALQAVPIILVGHLGESCKLHRGVEILTQIGLVMKP